jgi:hypothetical protein
MKLSTRILLPFIFAATAGAAMAQSGPLTRAEVKADLAEAIRTGNILATGETGLMRNQLNPGAYPAKPVQMGNTRAQVQAELAEAIRTGNVLANAESGLKLNEINPSAYPAKPVVMGKSRAQVVAELAEAQRLGLVDFNDTKYPVVATQQQVEQIRQAGLNAAGGMKVSLLK